MSIGTIDGALYNAFGQRQISTIYSDTNQYEVVVTALPAQTATPAALDRIHVRPATASMVPISAVAHQQCRDSRQRRSATSNQFTRWI